MKDTITVEAVGEHLLNLEKEIAHLTKVTQMHRRIIDMLVKDMLQLMPNKPYLQIEEQSDDSDTT